MKKKSSADRLREQKEKAFKEIFRSCACLLGMQGNDAMEVMTNVYINVSHCCGEPDEDKLYRLEVTKQYFNMAIEKIIDRQKEKLKEKE